MRLTSFLPILTLLALSGCGNSWINHKPRDGLASELYRDGKLAADNLDFNTAVEKFSQALELDPNNESTRLRLAYSYNGKAGLGAIEIFTNTNAAKTQSLNATASGLAQVAALVGFTAEDKQAFIDKLNSTTDRDINTIRSFSARLKTIHAGWKTVCRLLPRSVIKNNITADKNISRVMSGSACRAGRTDSQVRSSAPFAAILQLLTEAIYIYQTILDADDDGKIDFVEQATKINDDIKAVQSSIASAAGPEIVTLMTTLNASLAKLKAIGDTFRSDPVIVAITEFATVSELVNSVSGIPDDLKSQMTQSSGKLAEAKSIIDSFSASASANTQTTNNTSTSGAQASAAAASKAMEDLSNKIETLSGAEREQAQAQYDQACGQFDSVKLIYGLPADTQKPASCQ